MIKAFLFKNNAPRGVIFLIDIAIVAFAFFMAYMLRFNFSVPNSEIPLIKYALISVFGIRTLSFLLGKTYVGIIRYTSTDDAKRILFVNFLGSIIIALSNLISYSTSEIFVIPFSIIIIEFLLSSFLMVSSRAFVKSMYAGIKNPVSERSPILIFGAGEAGMIAKKNH